MDGASTRCNEKAPVGYPGNRFDALYDALLSHLCRQTPFRRLLAKLNHDDIDHIYDYIVVC